MNLVDTLRWDVGYAVMISARGMSAPTEERMVAAKRVLRHVSSGGSGSTYGVSHRRVVSEGPVSEGQT